MRTILRLGVAGTVVIGLLASALAQDACVSSALNRPLEPVIFSLKQELALGDAVARQLAVSHPVIKDPQLTSRLEVIVARLAQYLPNYAPKPKLLLIDDPEANAFNVAGGYVYVTRKLIAASRSEDELASVVAHELGHLAVRHAAATQSKLFKAVLDISTLEPNADIEALYHKVYDNYLKDPRVLRRAGLDTEAEEQSTADAIAVYLTVRAGYLPQAGIEFFDRLAETKGKTGNWISDLFGVTRPDSKRLRFAIKTLADMPPACKQAAQAVPAQDYLAWRELVVNYTPKHAQSLHSVVSQVKLVPPMRSEVTQLKYSPDGKYILAQDGENVFVALRSPLRVEFRIDAPGVEVAKFTPDSQGLVFYTGKLRVEKWSIPDRKRISANEMVIRQFCYGTALAPDGSLMACLHGDEKGVFPLNVTLFDVTNSTPVYTKKNYYRGNYADFRYMLEQLSAFGDLSLADMQFSPDGKYFLAGGWGAQFALDLTTRTELKLPSTITRLMKSHFAFMGPDRLVGVNNDNAAKSAIVHFPDGEVQREFTLGRQRLYGPAKGDYVILRPVSKHAVGVMDPKLNQIVWVEREDAFDIYDDIVVTTRLTGQIAMYRIGWETPITSLDLPLGRMGPIHAISRHEETNRMAISGSTNGAIYGIANGERTLQLGAFEGVWLDNENAYLLYPPPEHRVAGQRLQTFSELKEKAGPSVNRVNIKTGNSEQLTRFAGTDVVEQVGPYLLITTRREDKHIFKGYVLEVRDLRTNSTLWKRECSEPLWIPAFDPNSGAIVLVWYLDGKDAAEQIKSDPELKRRVDRILHKEASWLIEVADIDSGKLKTHFTLDTGNRSIRVRSVGYSKAALLAVDTEDRLHIYSATGEPRTTLFGRHAALSTDGKLLALEAEPGVVSLYDFEKLQKKDEFVFAHAVSFASFSRDSTKLMAITEDEVVYVLDVSGSGKTQAINTPEPPARQASQ